MTPGAALHAVPEVTRERPSGDPGKQQGPATPERLAEFYAAELAAGQVPSARQIKREWPVGYDRATELHDQPDGGDGNRVLNKHPRPGVNCQETTGPGVTSTSPRKEGRHFAPYPPSSWTRQREVCGVHCCRGSAAGRFPSSRPARVRRGGQYGAVPGCGDSGRVRPRPARQALRVRRHWPGRVRLLGACPGGVARRLGCLSRVPVEQQWADLPACDLDRSRVTWCSTPVRRSTRPLVTSTMYAGGGQMIEAYGAGVPIRITAARPGVWGYAAPGGAS